MNLTELIYFNEVASTSHFTKAAENLNVSQPALSRTIKSLENKLDVPLFVKRGRNVTLSNYGEVLYKHSSSILNELKSINLELNDLKEETTNTISILVNSASSQMKNLLVDFQKKYKNINIKVTQLDKTEYEKRKKDFDLIIRSDSFFNPSNNQECLLEEQLMLTIPKDNKLSKKKYIDLSEIANENLISLSLNKDLREINDYYCKIAGFTPKYCFENNSPSVIKDYITTGLGFAIIPSVTWKEIIPNDKINVVKILNPNCKRYVILEWDKNSYTSKTSTILKDYIINNFSNFL